MPNVLRLQMRITVFKGPATGDAKRYPQHILDELVAGFKHVLVDAEVKLGARACAVQKSMKWLLY